MSGCFTKQSMLYSTLGTPTKRERKAKDDRGCEWRRGS